jgi:hypothetical protein
MIVVTISVQSDARERFPRNTKGSTRETGIARDGDDTKAGPAILTENLNERMLEHQLLGIACGRQGNECCIQANQNWSGGLTLSK